MMKKLLLVPAIGVIASLGVAAAALLDGVEEQTLAAGDATVVSCGTVAVGGIVYDTAFLDGTGYVVEGVTVTFADNGCDGLDAAVQLTSGGNAIGDGAATATVATDTVAFSFTTSVPVTDVDDLHLLVGALP